MLPVAKRRIQTGISMETHSFNALLQAVGDGEPYAADVLGPTIYAELHSIAQRHMRQEKPGHTLQATALVNEAYLKLAGAGQIAQNKRHFLALSANAMRQVLVDHARAKSRAKRGGDPVRVTVTEWPDETVLSNEDIIDLDAALEKLWAFDERAARALELMYFCGMTYEEIGEALGIGQSTVFDDLKAAKAWLAVQMGSPSTGA